MVWSWLRHPRTLTSDQTLLETMSPEKADRLKELCERDPDATTGKNKHTRPTMVEELLLCEVPGYNKTKLERKSRPEPVKLLKGTRANPPPARRPRRDTGARQRWRRSSVTGAQRSPRDPCQYPCTLQL